MVAINPVWRGRFSHSPHSRLFWLSIQHPEQTKIHYRREGQVAINLPNRDTSFPWKYTIRQCLVDDPQNRFVANRLCRMYLWLPTYS